MKLSAQAINEFITLVPGFNPGPHTLEGTNTYLLGSKGRRLLLLDPAEGRPEQVELLNKLLKEQQATIGTMLITHNHYDHCYGVPAWLSHTKEVLKFGRHDFDLKVMKEKGFEYTYMDKEAVGPEEFRLRPLFTPGHCSDHFAFWNEERKCLFTGDCVLGYGSCFIDNLNDYMRSLKLLLSFDAELLLPGHGPVIHGAENCRKRIQEVFDHRMKRESEIVQCLQKGPCTIQMLADTIYKGLDHKLVPSAVGNLKVHLAKLVQQNKVLEKGEEFVWQS